MQAQDTPYGYCKCGCGQKTRLATQNLARQGYVKGEPLDYCRGHRGKHRPEFEYTVEDRGFTTPCWIWARALDTGGYARLMVNRRTHAAHRLLYERTVGPIPDDTHLDHLCRNRSCVNPDHLEPVTCAENVRRGDSTPLTKTDVEYIRIAVEQGRTQAEVSREFGVTPTAIWNIVHGKTWSAR